MKKKLTGEDLIDYVFACRGAFNEEHYIQRPQQETDLKRQLKQYRYVFVTGESGSGKTWLTNHCFPEITASDYINLSDVSIKGGLTKYMENTMPELLTEKNEEKELSGTLAIATGAINTNETYKINTDILWEFIKIRENHVIILDNFESILNNSKVIDEISCLITLADDPLMQTFNPRFIIIGALGDIDSFFNTLPNYQTIANRTSYVKIPGFNDTECFNYVNKGFRETEFTSSDIDELSKYIYNTTNGMPQAVSELCYYIAIKHFDEHVTDITCGSSLVNEANRLWVQKRMFSEYLVIKKYYYDNLEGESTENLNYILASIDSFGLRTFSAEQMRSKAEEVMGDNYTTTLNINKVRNFLDLLSDDSENRNLLIKTEYREYKAKSFKTNACITLSLDVNDDGVIFIDDLVG